MTRHVDPNHIFLKKDITLSYNKSEKQQANKTPLLCYIASPTKQLPRIHTYCPGGHSGPKASINRSLLPPGSGGERQSPTSPAIRWYPSPVQTTFQALTCESSDPYTLSFQGSTMTLQTSLSPPSIPTDSRLETDGTPLASNERRHRLLVYVRCGARQLHFLARTARSTMGLDSCTLSSPFRSISPEVPGTRSDLVGGQLIMVSPRRGAPYGPPPSTRPDSAS